ncbi:MAG: serine hydrolase [Flavobacteriales bacterium]|nr:serine hydrolase [Flavobacteriales bacterium]
MKHFTKFIFIVLFLQGLTSQSYAQLSPKLNTLLQDKLESMQKSYGFKGLSVAVTIDNANPWVSAVGISSENEPLNPNMLIGVGSNTKTFVSATILKMVERDELSLDDTIGKWISTYANIPTSIKIRQLLNHTSGLNYYLTSTFWEDASEDLTKIWTIDEILTNYVGEPVFAAGSKFDYCNTNYLVLGLLIEKLSGEPCYKIIRKEIIDPLQLKSTFYPPYETVDKPYAHFWSDLSGNGYLDDIGNYSDNDILPNAINSIPNSAGAIVSTASDNIKFWRSLFEGRIISNQTLNNEMLNFIPISSGRSVGYGLGIFKDNYLGNTVFSHGGTWLGQINSNLVDTSRKVYITVLSNQDSLKNNYTELVVLQLYKILLDNWQYAEIPAIDYSQRTDVYPNPSSGYFTVDLPEGVFKSPNIQVYDMLGNEVMNSSFDEMMDAQISINLSGQNEGIYLLKISSPQTDSLVFKKVVLTH